MWYFHKNLTIAYINHWAGNKYIKEKWKLHSNYVLNFVYVNSNGFNEIKNKENAFTLLQKIIVEN